MPDVEHNTRFEIYLTPTNGVQIVTNEISIAILTEMRYHQISPSEIATAMNIHKSTVQANIVKLLRMGIVSQETSKQDARRVIYHICGLLLFTDDSNPSWKLDARLAAIQRILKSGRCTSKEDFSLYAISLVESGLNVFHGLFNLGSTLIPRNATSYYLNGLLTKDPFMQTAEKDLKVDVITDDGLEVDVESAEQNISDIPLLMAPMLGAVVSNSREILGYNLVHAMSLSVNEEGSKVNILVPPFEGNSFDDRLPPLSERGKKFYWVSEPFSIYSVKGNATLFFNRTMNEALYLLTEGGKSAKDLASTIGVSEVTVYASLNRLVELGAVEIDRNSKSPKIYHLIADPIMYCRDPDIKSYDKIQDILMRFHRKEVDYYTAIIGLALEYCGMMGLHFDKMFIKAGRSSARTVLSWVDRKITPEEFLNLACKMVSLPDKAEVVSLLPIRIRVTLSPDTLWTSWPGDFVKGFISEGLKILLDTDYKVDIETIQQK
ncbi:MAG: hypothetical protein IJ856_05035 [Candidatus Methanomethylophilaceae archaeon]|nr:hypothetical protein [Candidatus Methanomethylophilaceae archaeon]